MLAASMADTALTPLQQKLSRAPAWPPGDVAAVFKERPTGALHFLAELAEGRSLVGSTKAYKCLEPLLWYLLEHPKIDIEPLVPLLRQLCGFAGYDPGGTRQYELVRNHAMRLLARRKDPVARAMIERYIGNFPERRDHTYAVSLVEVMGEAALHLGAHDVEPALRALLDTMLLEYSPRQRQAELASCVATLERLAKVRPAKPQSKPPAAATKRSAAKARTKRAR